MNTCAVKIEWPFNVHLKDLLLLKLRVLLFYVLTRTRNIAYSNVGADVNQIFLLQFCACANRLYCIVARTRKTGVNYLLLRLLSQSLLSWNIDGLIYYLWLEIAYVGNFGGEKHWRIG